MDINIDGQIRRIGAQFREEIAQHAGAGPIDLDAIIERLVAEADLEDHRGRLLSHLHQIAEDIQLDLAVGRVADDA